MKDVNTMKGLHGLRTMLSSKKRSAPRIRSSAYLDLYMMGKEKDRLLKESERLGMRSSIINKRLREIGDEMGKIREAGDSVSRAGAKKNSSGNPRGQKAGTEKPWKKMSLKY